jgi:hypothetical protein
MAQMKTKIFLLLLAVGIVATGCVSTVGGDGKKAVGMPGPADKISGIYNRSVDQVFAAAKNVLKNNGSIDRESNILNQTNAVRTLVGKVNQRKVWMKVEALDLKPTTQVTVQARGSWGGTDQPLTHQLEKEIALELTK